MKNNFLEKFNLFLILGIIFFVPIFFIPSIFNSFTLPKIVLFRSLVLILFFSCTINLFLKNKFILLNKKLIIFIFFIFLSILISSFLSASWNFSFWGLYNRQMGFYSYASLFSFFFLLISFVEKKEDIDKIIYTILVSVFLVSLYAILQYWGFDLFSWNKSPYLTGRTFSFLGQPNFLGHFLAINIPLTVYVFVFLVKKIVFKFILFFLSLAQFYALILTLSRSAWLASLVGLVAGFFIFLTVKGRKKLFIYSFVFFLTLSLFLSILSFSNHYNDHYSGYYGINTRISNLLNFNQGSGLMRLYYWKASLIELSQANLKIKLFGYGADNLGKVFVKYYTKDWGVHETINTYPDRPHNLILDILLHFGLLGFLSFCFLVFYISYKLFEYFKNSNKDGQYWFVFSLSISLLIYFLNNLFSFSNISGFVYFYLYLALICIIVFKCDMKEIKINLSTASKYLILLFLFIFSLSFIFFKNINLVYADYYYTKSLKSGLASENKCLKSFNFINKALNYNPDSLFYKEEYIRYNLNCYYYFKDYDGGKWIDNNLLDIIKNIKGQEDNYNFRLYEARIYSLLSQKDSSYYVQAENIFKSLIEKSPYITTAYKEIARLKMQEGQEEEAIDYLKRAIEVSPLTSNKYLNKEHKEELESELNSINNILNSFQYRYNNKN